MNLTFTPLFLFKFIFLELTMYTTLKSLGWLIAFCLLLVVAFLSLLHTPYAQQVLNPLVQKITQQQVSFGGINYSIQSPLHLTLSDITIHTEENEHDLNIQQIDFWLSQYPIQNKKLAFDNIKIDGLNLQNGLPNTDKAAWISIAHLSISNLDFSHKGLVIRDAHIQLTNWSVDENKTLPFEGDFQFLTTQLYWQGEALNDILIDGFYTQNYTALHGISLTWRDSTITAQAELKENKLWVIPQFTLRKFNLESDNTEVIGKPLEWLAQQNFTYQFDRIDLLDINIELPQLIANNLSLSAENVLFPYHLWQQTDANISFNADSLVLNEYTIEKPIFNLMLNGKEANISNLSFDIFNGNIQLAGKVSPTDVELTSLTLGQIKWLISHEEMTAISQYITQLNLVNIAQLDINNIQLIQLDTQHPYQITGLNAEGSDLELRRYSQWGLWNGELSLSASNASVNYLLTQQPLIEMNTQEGLWSIDRALFPLSEGLIGFNGKIHLAQDSQPWQLEAYGDGLPVDYFSQLLSTDLPLDGITEFTFSGNGLASNRDSFNYSFNGELNLAPREMTTTKTALELWQSKLGLTPDKEQLTRLTERENESKANDNIDSTIKNESSITQYPINIDPITILANRGRISIVPILIKGEGFSYRIQGDYDLVNPKQAQTTTSLIQECHQLVQRLFSEEVQVINNCQ